MKNIFGEGNEVKKESGEVNVGGFAEGQDKFNIATQKAVSILKRKVDESKIKEILVMVAAGEKIEEETIANIVEVLKNELDNGIKIEFSNIVNLPTMGDKVEVHLNVNI